MDPNYTSGRSQAFCKSAADKDVAAIAALTALPLPLADHGFSRACDVLTCRQGLGWAGPERYVLISSCAKCGEARYCSQACQKVAWSGKTITAATGTVGHKFWCGHLRAAPRPLRLIHRLVCSDKLEKLGLLRICKTSMSHFFDMSDPSMGVDVGVQFSDSIFSNKRGVQPTEAAALMALMNKIKPSRLVLIVPHVWAHSGSGSGESRHPDVTLFEVGYTADEGVRGSDGGGMQKVRELCDALIQGVETALPYMYAEEDRLSEGVRYAPSTGSPKVGAPCPPRLARVHGAKIGACDIVVDAGIMGMRGGARVTMLGPARWRWATMGPFQIAEMPLEDLDMKRLQFYKPVGWPEGWFTVTTEIVARALTQFEVHSSTGTA